jgi:hypothetical protein
MISSGYAALKLFFPDQVKLQYPGIPADAIYGTRSTPTGHLYFSWLRDDEGKASAGHYELLVEGSYRAMELPLEVAHILDHSHKDDEEHEVVNRTDPKVEPDTLQEDSCSIPANSSCQSRLCTYSLFCVCVNRYIYIYINTYIYI